MNEMLLYETMIEMLKKKYDTCNAYHLVRMSNNLFIKSCVNIFSCVVDLSISCTQAKVDLLFTTMLTESMCPTFQFHAQKFSLCKKHNKKWHDTGSIMLFNKTSKGSVRSA